MINQGLRPDCEVLQIRHSNVDLVAGKLFVPQSKSRASKRLLELTEESKRVLGRRIGATPGPWVFPGREHVGGPRYREVSDRPLSYSGLISAHNRLLNRIRNARPTFPAFALYSLRHKFATWFYDRTHDVVALKDVLGHSDLRTILRYVNDNQARMSAAMKKFEEGGTQRRESVN